MPLAAAYLEAINDAQQSGQLPEFQGFDGAHTADEVGIVSNYINGIAHR